MTPNRYLPNAPTQYRPHIKHGINSPSLAIAPNHKHADKLFLISCKLRELARLVTLKLQHISEVRQRIAENGSSFCLEQEIREQQEQIEYLIQFSEDWFNLSGLLRDNPSLPIEHLSAPLLRMVWSLGIPINTSYAPSSE